MCYKCLYSGDKYVCRQCADGGLCSDGSPRYSMGVYAGTYCDECWEKDGRNHGRQYDFLDAGEYYDESQY